MSAIAGPGGRRRRLPWQFPAWAFTLLALEGVLAVLGWTSHSDEAAFTFFFRWSSTVGTVLALALVVVLASGAAGALDTLIVLTGVRTVAVPLAMIMIGWSDGGRSNPSFLVLVVLATGVAAAGLLLAIASRRELSRAPRAVR